MTLGCVIVLIMPGPTNTLLATAGLRWGVRRSVHLTGAEFAGYFVSISGWGYFLSHAATSLAWPPTLLRVGGVALNGAGIAYTAGFFERRTRIRHDLNQHLFPRQSSDNNRRPVWKRR